MTDHFYRAFEDRLRGPRELIRSRLEAYIPFIEPLKATYAGSKAIDLGCGRGEWLELVNELGFEGTGVDLDEGMLAVCRELNLDVERKELLACLNALPDASVAIVSGFHVAEHIAFTELQTLVQEALRVLLPGGLLIMETPNPENMVVAGTNFYLDPTHERPLPPLLLSFLPEYYGFERVKVLRLQEAAGLSQSNRLTLLGVLNGVSPDYAVVAQKSGPDELLAATRPAFAEEYGITLESLANRYDQQAEARAQHSEDIAQQAENIAQQAEARAQQAEARAQQAENAAQQAENAAQQAEAKAQQAENIAQQAEARAQHGEDIAQQAENAAQQAEARAQQADAVLTSVINSRSWRITRPLRLLVNGLRRLRNGGKQALKSSLKPIVGRAIRFVSARPRLKRPALAWVRKHPRLEQRLRRFAVARGLAGSEVGRSSAQIETHPDKEPDLPMELANLTPHARRIYADLKTAIERRRKENG